MAIKSYKALLKISPRNAEVHYYLGLVYKHYYNDKKKALFHFKKCLKIDPEFKNKNDIKYLIKMGWQNEW